MPTLQGYTYDRTVTASVWLADQTWDGYHLSTDKDRLGRQWLVSADVGSPIDVSWLKAAAEVYDLNPDIKNYVFAEVPGCQAELPNRNLDAFPFNELTKFRPILGRVAYRSFIGKGCSQDHDNKDPKKFKGVCFDASMQKQNGHWYVKVVVGFSRDKDAVLAERVLKNRDSGYSMACLIGGAHCSYCNHFSKGDITCKCINGGLGKGSLVDGHLVHERLFDLNFWELAHVEDPADIDALKDWSQ